MSKLTKIWLIGVGVIFLGLLGMILSSSKTTKKELRLATGPIGSDSYAFGLSYQALLKNDGVTLTLVPTQGSLDTLGVLQNKQADIGFVHSGILADKPEYALESLASVYFEPLWIFYRHDGYKLNYLIEASGKHIAVGVSNDGTYDIAKKILESNGITPETSTLLYIGDDEAKEALKSGKIDMFLTLATEQNPNITALLDEPKIELLGLKRAKAYAQKFTSLKSLTINEGSIDLYKNIPDETISVLSTTQNLVCVAGLPDELVRIFLKKVKAIHAQRNFYEQATTFPNLKYLDTHINSEAEVYLTVGDSWLEEIFPYWVAANIDRFKLLIIPLLGLLIPLLKSIIPLYVFTMRSKIFRWYKRLYAIDLRLKSDNAQIEGLKQELAQLKDEVQNKTKVPLSYMGEYYNLLMHIDLLEQQLSKK